ncbi:BppU family phage baseplate upper protein [Collinsella tanakaei]|uniref:BppU family phage baseplate upper protein n=1 Tax=Collinsella tanakaei TaxID=626935 RepID=UPI0022DF567F|nr:BppU family phage baseplate upper protein [Collinsella tanakaei]
MAVTELTLDTAKPQDRIEMVTGRQGDTATVIRVTVLNNGDAYDFDGKYLEFAMVRPKGDAKVEWIHLKEAVVQEGSTNVWNCTLPEAATAYDGLAKLCYFVVRSKTDESFRDSTQRFMVKLDASATAEVHVGYYSDQVDKLIREAILLTEQWEQQMKAQQAAYLAAEARRDESYEAAEAERGTRYSQAEARRDKTFSDTQAQRQAAFEQAEAARQQTFNTNEADRGRRSNEAVQAANQATERANDAAESVEQAVGGNLDPLFRDWIDAQKDVAGGLVSYDKYQREMVVADGETLLKTGSTISVKEKGLEAKHVKDLAEFRGALGLGATTSALPVANGGTGANTIEGARQNILNFPTNDELLSYLGLK